MTNRDRKPRADRRGAAIVETAIILPVFFLVLLGIVEFGQAMMARQVVTTAARDAGRMAIVGGFSNAEVEQSVKDFLTDALGLGSGDIDVSITVTPSGSDLAAAQKGELCTIHVEIPFDEVSLISGNYLSGATLKGRCMMRHL